SGVCNGRLIEDGMCRAMYRCRYKTIMSLDTILQIYRLGGFADVSACLTTVSGHIYSCSRRCGRRDLAAVCASVVLGDLTVRAADTWNLCDFLTARHRRQIY
ncbi:unnamed protein product, partial [Pylaiella littoralis]